MYLTGLSELNANKTMPGISGEIKPGNIFYPVCIHALTL